MPAAVAFAPPTPLLARLPRCDKAALPAHRPSHHSAPRMALSGPNRQHDRRSVRPPSGPGVADPAKKRRGAPHPDGGTATAASSAGRSAATAAAEPHDETEASVPLPPTDDFSNWSSDFLRLCNEQLALLMATLPLVEQAALFFRRENAATGALEFVPLMVHSADRGADAPARVWISGGAGAGTTADPTTAPATDADDARRLPGSIPAAWLLPDYPFANVAPHGGIPLPDGGLCVPVLHDGTLAGTIMLRGARARNGAARTWSADETRRAAMVAKTIALGAALEGKWHAGQTVVHDSQRLIASVRALLRNTLHQVRSPIQALVTFGHILMRRLPVSDESRGVAKNIVVQAFRVDELLHPLDRADEVLALPSPPDRGHPEDADRAVNNMDAMDGVADDDEDDEEIEKSAPGAGTPSRPADPAVLYTPYVQRDAPQDQQEEQRDSPQLQFVWLADVLEPLFETWKMLAAERGLQLTIDVDEDMPAVWAVGAHAREAVSNIVDNALKYTPAGSAIAVRAWVVDTDDAKLLPGVAVPPHADAPDAQLVCLAVSDTGHGVPDDEQDDVWRYGRRTAAAERSGAPGSGIGLSLVRELLRQCGAAVTLLSPLPAELDGRDAAGRAEGLPGAAFVIVFRRARR